MGKRVLVADDSVTIQRAFAMVFSTTEVELLPARTYDEALTLARQARPDLILADLNLGGRSGYDLCAALKADPGLRAVPVYILASGQTPYDEAKGKQAGAEGPFLKPFESLTTVDKILDALAKPATAGPALVAPTPVAAAPAARTPSAPAADTNPGLRTLSEPDDEDDYGEFSIELSGASAKAVPPAPAPAPAPVPAPVVAPPAVGSGLRPSLIPGARPGLAATRPAVPAAPAAMPARPAAPAPSAPLALSTPPAAAPRGMVSPPSSRTIMGMPAVGPASGARPGSVPSSAPAASTGSSASLKIPGLAPPAAVSASDQPTLRSQIGSKIDEKFAQLAARGPEYEALAKLSREVIEQVVWEVVPELAELIIRQEIDRLAKAGIGGGK